MEEKLDIKFLNSFFRSFKGGDVYLSREYWNEGIAIIYLNNPKKRNAMSGKMMVDLNNCISELERWEEGKAVILTGEGCNFCSGGDLEFAEAADSPEDGNLLSYYMQEIILKRIRKLPKVTITLAHGPTLGGGAELALFTDYILVADNVKFGFVHGKMGITTAWGGTTRLLQLVGERQTLEMQLTSKVYSAEECLQIGLAYRIIDTDKRLEQCLTFVRQLIVHDVSIIHAIKQNVANSKFNSFENALKLERQIFSSKWGSKLNREALKKRIKHVDVKNVDVDVVL